MNTVIEHSTTGSGFAPRPKYSELAQALPPGAVLMLTDVSWEEYEELLVELDEQPRFRLTYDHGDLEIMTLSPEHEGPARLFGYLIQILTEEMETDFISLGSTTLRDKLAESGAEADDCFYIGDFAAVAGIKRLDLSVAPPPDLAIEIDITSRSLKKLPVYAALGVKELWRFTGKRVQFHLLSEGRYVKVKRSGHFSFLTPDVLPGFLEQGRTQGINAMRRAFREWVRTAGK
jgi:Uma2 family endonuclease